MIARAPLLAPTLIDPESSGVDTLACGTATAGFTCAKAMPRIKVLLAALAIFVGLALSMPLHRLLSISVSSSPSILMSTAPVSPLVLAIRPRYLPLAAPLAIHVLLLNEYVSTPSASAAHIRYSIQQPSYPDARGQTHTAIRCWPKCLANC